MTNSTSTDITFGGAQCNSDSKAKDWQSTAPADKQIAK